MFHPGTDPARGMVDYGWVRNSDPLESQLTSRVPYLPSDFADMNSLPMNSLMPLKS